MTIAFERETTNAESDSHRTGLKVGIPKEIFPGECRVAATPETVKTLEKMGFHVLIETGAGSAAHFSDEAYRQVGCQIINDAATLWREADIVLKVRSPLYNEASQQHEVDLLSPGKTLISFIYPAQNSELLQKLSEKQVTVLAMDAVPRISRAQKMDALSSMANLAGYRAVIEAANQYGRCFTGQITAAGKMPPTKVLIIGAGVAGLAAIGAARGLGAVVRAFDTRPVVGEQVQSLGAEFLQVELEEDGSGQGGYAKEMSKEFIEAEMALFAEQAQEVDIIITTALIPGKKAPLLITKAMVDSMKPGSVVVDMAAEQGGNCEVTKPNEIHRYNDITIIGLTDLPSRMATQASQLYGTNLCHLLKDMGGSEQFHVDLEDEVVRGALVLNQGEITYPPPKPSTPSPAAPAPTASVSEASVAAKTVQAKTIPWNVVFPIIATLALVGLGSVAPQSFLSHFTVFVLACFIGWQVIWNVKPALHTPLMSVTNAISGIIILGGMLQISGELHSATTILGAIAILIGTINISGGFLVTQRMLKMFQK
jgi:H+-translocating NAD(P) transhydrogenase subunit alpha